MYVDASYGAVGFATIDSPHTIITEGVYFINFDDIVVLDKDYYGVTKYIWT